MLYSSRLSYFTFISQNMLLLHCYYLLTLPQGSRIHPRSSSAQIIRGSRGGYEYQKYEQFGVAVLVRCAFRILAWWFSSGLTGKFQDGPSSGSWPLPSKLFPIHYSAIIPPLDPAYCEILAPSLRYLICKDMKIFP